MNPLDFQSFVETLSQRTGVHIDDADTPRLITLSSCADFFVARPE